MSLTVRPKLFADGLANAAEFSTNKKGLVVNDSVHVSWTGEKLRFMGRGKYSGCVHDLTPATHGNEKPWDVIVSIDTATEAAKALRASPGSGKQATTVDVIGLSDGSVQIVANATSHEDQDTSNPPVIVGLENAPGHEELRPTEEFEGFYEKLERIGQLPAEPIPPASPIVFTRDVVAKLSKLKTEKPGKDPDRWELHYIGGATWIYRHYGNQVAVSAMLESCRDSLE